MRQQKIILPILLCLISMLISSCGKEDAITNPEEENIDTPKVEEVECRIVDGYADENSKAYMFSNGNLLTITPDTIYGYTIQADSLQMNGEWSKEKQIIVYLDSLKYPKILISKDHYAMYEYDEKDNVIVSVYDKSHKELGTKTFPLSSVMSLQQAKTRGFSDVITTADISLGIAGLAQFALHPNISGYISSLCTLIGWGDASQGHPGSGAAWGTVGSVVSLLANAASKLNWAAAAASAAAFINELDRIYRDIFFGSNPYIKILSISPTCTSATIEYELNINGECKNPQVGFGYRHKDSSTFHKTTSGSKGKNTVTLTDLEVSKSYNVNVYAYNNSTLGIFGSLSTRGMFTTLTPSSQTGSATEIKDKSAKVKCTFKNIPEGATCGIKYSKGNSYSTVSANNSEKEQTVTIGNLEPATEYSYYAYIEYKGNSWKGESRTFTTAVPDISGTWNCTEEYYTGWDYSQKQTKSYSIVLNSNGSAEVNDGSNYVSASWTYSSSGQVTINVSNISTQTQDFGTVYEGKVNDVKNPTVITGGRYTWAFNQVIGYVRHDDYHNITMTK